MELPLKALSPLLQPSGNLVRQGGRFGFLAQVDRAFERFKADPAGRAAGQMLFNHASGVGLDLLIQIFGQAGEHLQALIMIVVALIHF